MKCIGCGRDSDTKVTHSHDDGEMVRRRRECLECGERFTTFEVIAPRENADPKMTRVADRVQAAIAQNTRLALHDLRKDIDDDQLTLL